MAKKKQDPRAPIVSAWNNQPRYECPFCQWDTLEEAKAIAHIDEFHPEPQPTLAKDKARHIFPPRVPEDLDDAESNAHENDSAGTESDRGRRGDDDGGGHDQ